MIDFLPPASIIDSTPGLTAARKTVAKAESALAAIKRPERGLDEVSRIRPSWVPNGSANPEREPLAGVPFAVFDSVRVEWDCHYAAVATAERTLNAARKHADGLLYGHDLTPEAHEARRVALGARAAEVARVLESDPLTSAQRAVLLEEAKVLEVFGALSGESLRGVLERGGVSLGSRPVLDESGDPIPGLFENVRVSLEGGVEVGSMFSTSEYRPSSRELAALQSVRGRNRRAV